MTKVNLNSRNDLINKVVRQLIKCGFEVRSYRVGNLRPVIEIERPNNLCPGFTITTCNGPDRTLLNVTSLEGCLITWRA